MWKFIRQALFAGPWMLHLYILTNLSEDNHKTKEYFTWKWHVCHSLLTLILYQTCMTFSLLWNIKRYFEDQIMFFIHTMKVICIPQKREDLHVWFNMRLSKWKQKIHFWVNYLFNAGLISTFNWCFSANQKNEMQQHKHASLQCE